MGRTRRRGRRRSRVISHATGRATGRGRGRGGLERGEREQQGVGLGFEGLLKLGGGAQQWRHDMHGSVLKINHRLERLPDAAQTGYDGLIVTDETVDEPVTMLDPEGNRVTLVQPGFEGIDQIAIDRDLVLLNILLQLIHDSLHLFDILTRLIQMLFVQHRLAEMELVAATCTILVVH